MAPKLGEILICAKIIDQHQLESALSEQQKWGGKLGEILVNSGLCSEEMMVRALSRQLDVPRAELDRLATVSPEALAKIPLDLSQALDVLPIELRDNGALLVVAMSDPLNAAALDELKAKVNCRVHALLAGPHAIARARQRLYGLDEAATSSPTPPRTSILKEAEKEKVVKRVSDYSKIVDRSALDLSIRATSTASAQRKTGGATTSGEVSNGVLAEGIQDIAAAVTIGGQGAAEETLSLVRALIETLIEKGVFSRDEFLRHLSSGPRS